MTKVQSSGVDPGQRRLNGPQTTGRPIAICRNLSSKWPTMTMLSCLCAMALCCLRTCTVLLRLAKYPVLIAASPYPRQIQNLGAPAGFN